MAKTQWESRRSGGEGGVGRRVKKKRGFGFYKALFFFQVEVKRIVGWKKKKTIESKRPRKAKGIMKGIIFIRADINFLVCSLYFSVGYSEFMWKLSLKPHNRFESFLDERIVMLGKYYFLFFFPFFFSFSFSYIFLINYFFTLLSI